MDYAVVHEGLAWLDGAVRPDVRARVGLRVDDRTRARIGVRQQRRVGEVPALVQQRARSSSVIVYATVNAGRGLCRVYARGDEHEPRERALRDIQGDREDRKDKVWVRPSENKAPPGASMGIARDGDRAFQGDRNPHVGSSANPHGK